MKMTQLFVLLSAITLGSGCATPYQPLDGRGGYRHNKITDHEYEISFRGNGDFGYRRARNYALLRAAQIGHELRFTHFTVEGEWDATQTKSGAVLMPDTEAGHVAGQPVQMNSSTLVPYSYDWPEAVLRVRYYQTEPGPGHLEVHEVASVLQRVTAQYKIKL